MRNHKFAQVVVTGAAAVFFSAALLSPVRGAESPEEIQGNRTATMKSIGKALRAIRVFVKAGQMKELAESSMQVAEFIDRIPELSPKGSAFGEKSRIKPEVWEDFDQYKKLAEKSSAAARALAKAAGSGDKDSAAGAFRAFGKSCGACHKPFRKKKKKR
jgi:cytochrome c556